jgi:hypothetical protein
MLNAGARPVTLALCHNPACEFTMMIPVNQKMIRPRKEKKVLDKIPVICTRCGSPEMRCLTIIKDESYRVTDELCYHCLIDEKSPYVINQEMVNELSDETSTTTPR